MGEVLKKDHRTIVFQLGAFERGTLLQLQKAEIHVGTRIGVLPKAAQGCAYISIPVHQLILDADANEVTRHIQAAQELNFDIENPKLQTILSRLTHLPALPEVYEQLRQEWSRPDIDIGHVADIIQTDPGLTSKIIQVANSPLFGLGTIDPRDATLFLGLQMVRTLALATALFAKYRNLAQIDIHAIWNHSWETAQQAYCIAKLLKGTKEQVENAFLAGLLHDIGKIVLAANVPELFRSMLQVATQQNLHITHTERTLYHATHAEIGGNLLAKWGLDTRVVQAVNFHHMPFRAKMVSVEITAVHLANCWSHPMHLEPDLAYLDSAGLTEKVAHIYQDLKTKT